MMKKKWINPNQEKINLKKVKIIMILKRILLALMKKTLIADYKYKSYNKEDFIIIFIPNQLIILFYFILFISFNF